MKKKKHLEIAIDSIPSHPNPKVELEQYSTPSAIASDLLWNAYSLGDILGKNIIDLGCGCGIFTVGSSLLGSNKSIGIDIDEDSVKVARDFSKDMENVEFIVNDVSDIDVDSEIDTVFQNPPFGSQKFARKGQDLKFINAALKLNPSIIYSFHMASTYEFLYNYLDELNLEITHIFSYKFPIPKIYKFHKEENKNVEVIVLRIKI